MIEQIQERIADAMRQYHTRSPRAALAREGFLGPSDIGFCRQKAALVVKQTPPSDDNPKWAAFVGTAVGKEIEHALVASFPEWIVGSVSNLAVTAKLPSGAEISGHPDIVAPDINAVLDIKTVDGYATVRRDGTSKAHRFQRHLYAIGCVQAGILTDDKPLYVGNLYFDRSGKEPEPLVLVEEIDWTLTNEIDSWIGDVIYAVKNGEDASRDIPATICERICEFFTVCRGSLPNYEGGMSIEDPALLEGIRMYVEASELEKEAKGLKEAAKDVLAGVNGQSDDYQVRWVTVGPAYIEATTRAGYTRLDIRPVKKRLPGQR